MTIGIAGQPVAVEGNRAWHAKLPLSTARNGANASLDRLTLTMIDQKTGDKTMTTVLLPPGALGRRVELATLDVRAH